VTEEDPGEPIAYLALEPGTPVYAEGGTAVGRVRRVLAAEDEDIFDGIIIDTHHGDRFVDADQIGAIHERAVALKLPAAACTALPEPSANPAVLRDDPAGGAETPLDRLSDLGRSAWKRISGRY